MELLHITRQIHCKAVVQRATLIHRQYNRDWGTSYSRPPIDPYLISPLLQNPGGAPVVVTVAQQRSQCIHSSDNSAATAAAAAAAACSTRTRASWDSPAHYAVVQFHYCILLLYTAVACSLEGYPVLCGSNISLAGFRADTQGER